MDEDEKRFLIRELGGLMLCLVFVGVYLAGHMDGRRQVAPVRVVEPKP